MNNYQAIATWVKEERTKQQMTQQQLADKAGCRRQSVLEIEQCRCDYRIGGLLKVVEALGYKLTPTKVAFNFRLIKLPTN